MVEQLERNRMHFAFGLTAGAVPDEAPAASVVDEHLSQNAASGDASAEEENVERMIVHGPPSTQDIWRIKKAELDGQMLANSLVARMADGAGSRATRW